MKHAGRVAWISIVSNVVVITLLVILFTLPRNYIVKVTDSMDMRAAIAIDAVFSGDWEGVNAEVGRLETEFDDMSNTGKLFLNHEDVDELESSIAAAVRLARINDDAELLIQLERIRNTLEYLRGIETFDWVDLF